MHIKDYFDEIIKHKTILFFKILGEYNSLVIIIILKHPYIN